MNCGILLKREIYNILRSCFDTEEGCIDAPGSVCLPLAEASCAITITQALAPPPSASTWMPSSRSMTSGLGYRSWKRPGAIATRLSTATTTTTTP